MEKMNIKWNYTNKIVNDLLKINRAREIVDLLEIPVSVEEEIKKEQIARSLKHKSGNAQACAAGLIPARTQGEPCRAANAGAHSVNACMRRIRDMF